MFFRILRALAATVGILTGAVFACGMALVAQTGVDLSQRGNLIAFWSINILIGVAALGAIVALWIWTFLGEDARSKIAAHRLVRKLW